MTKYIKRMCEDAGWEIVNGWIRTPDEDCRFELSNKADFTDPEWLNIVYPLLLQRAIEGVNRKQDKWRIIQTDSAIRTYDSGSGFTIPETIFRLKNNPDQAKESAIEYIYEQEGKR